MTKLFKTMLIIGVIVVISMPLYAKGESDSNLDTGSEIIEIDDKIDTDKPTEYTAVRSRQQHALGGKSENASNGLARAASRSGAIAASNFSTKK